MVPMRNFVCLGLMANSGVCGFTFLSLAVAVLMTIPSKLWPLLGASDAANVLRRACCYLVTYPQQWWFSLASLLLVHVLGVRVVVHFVDDKSKKKKSAEERLKAIFAADRVLMLSNHPTTLDWMFLWVICTCVGNVGTLKICLKKSLAKVPVAGWTCQVLAFIFLERRRFIAEKEKDKLASLPDAPKAEQPKSAPTGEDDIDKIARCVRHFNNLLPYVALLFPEGTDLSDSNRRKAHAFAKEKGLTPTDYVLIPRKRGVSAFLREMPKDAQSKVVDITMAYVPYVPGERPTENTVFMQNRPPKEAHFLMESMEMEHDPDKIEENLKASYLRKEKFLKQFYTEGPPAGGVDVCHMMPVWKTIVTWFVLHALIIYIFYFYFIPFSLAVAFSLTLFFIFDVSEIRFSDGSRAKKTS